VKLLAYAATLTIGFLLSRPSPGVLSSLLDAAYFGGEKVAGGGSVTFHGSFTTTASPSRAPGTATGPSRSTECCVARISANTL
jgi:hypothetical protein